MSSVQLDQATQNVLTEFASRRRLLLMLRTIAVGIVFFVGCMTLVAGCDYLWLLSDGVRWFLSVSAYAATAGAMWWFGGRHFGSGDARDVARRLETADPGLREDLLSAVELADPRVANGSEGFRGWLQQRVGRRTAKINVGRLLPIGLIKRWLSTGLVILFVCLSMLLIPKMQFGRRMARAMLPVVPIERASLTKVTIVHPSPASGYVAEGDAIGVIVEVAGRPARDVVMEWRTRDGMEGESMMTPRIVPPSENTAQSDFNDGTIAVQNRFAANLSVATEPVEYRIIAGDAITLWHELTPLPRPRVESFVKRYVFPNYARLEDRTEEAEHGDLNAFVGTMAEVTVRFDQRVQDATLRFGNRGVTRDMEAVPGSDREFIVNIPIKTPAHYQVDATSADSGLNNPFSPQYSISPIIDTPPIVRWSPTMRRTSILSPLDVIHLLGTAVDDLPMEQIVQEFQVNAEPVVRRRIPVTESGRELAIDSDWDLMHRAGEEESHKLSGGDIVRTRLVAIDRRGHRGESDFIEILIAEEGFDKDRHQRLDELKSLTTKLALWAEQVKVAMTPLQKTIEKEEPELFESAKPAAIQIHEQRTELIQQIKGMMQSSTKLPETGALELLARAVLDLDQELTEWFVETDNLLQEDHPAWKKSREKRLRDASKRIREYTQEAQRIQQYAQAIFGEAMTVGIVADGMALRRSLRPMLDQQVPLPPQRFPRYLIVVEGRMAAIEEMIESHAEALPDSTKSHLRNWHRWVDNWTSRLEAAAKDPPKIDAFRALIAQFDNELNNQVSHAMIDGRLPSSLTNMLREIRIQIGPLSDQVRAMAKHGDSAQKSKAQIAREDESDKVAEYTRDEKYSAAAFDRRRAMVLERLQEEESIHRNRPAVDLQYAADMTLMSNAIENVAQEGYQPYKEEKPAEVFQKLGYAFQTIEAKHEADLWLGELQSLLLAERKLEPTASAKIKHATWLERFSSGLEWPVRTLKNVRIDNELIQAIDQPRYNQDFSQARERITSRRWGGPEMLTAEAPIDSLQRDLSQGLDAIVPKVTEARQTIQQYVLSLAEQAREAAEKADEAKERTDTRPDQKQETAEQLQTEQEEAEQAAEETMEALVDIANTADITDAEAREVARDADAAAAQIQDAKERAEEAAKQAAEASEEQARGEALEKTEEALEDLADALRDTAEHFEKLENGEDVSESREQLRQAEEELQIQDQLQQRQDQAEAMANAAQQSPQEMLEQLERELQDNEPMQEELSEIAERAADAAQKTLEEAARKETSLNQQLERSDQSFQERKRQKALQIQQLAHRASTVDQAMLNATERAVGWANTPRARPKLEEAREQLREAVQKANQMGGDQALLPKMNQTAKEMANALKAASEAIEDVKQQSEDAQDKNIHKDDRSRKQAKEQLERFERDARTQNGRGANTEKQRWSAYERDAGRRVQQAQSQKRSFEKQVDKIEDRLKKEKNENSRKQLTEQQAQYEQRVADAESNEKAAMETRDFAKQMGKAADDRKRESDRQKLTPLNEKNPAAELANRMSSQAQEELNKLQQELREVAKETEFGQELQVAPDQASSLAKQQQRIEQDVKDAAEQLRRAARHEERLGQEQLAQQLDAAAEAVAGEAAEAAAEATEALQQAAQDAQQAPAASREVAEAGKSISDVAEQLAQLLNGMTEQNAEATEATSQSPAENAEEGGESQQRAEQMAQTLDELDRSIAQSQSESQQQGQQQPGEQPGQQSGQEPGQQTAADASQTVANAMDAQSQRSARQRQQQMDPSQGQGQPGEEQSPNMPGSKPGNESGMPGQMPSGGMVDTRGVQRADGAWGQLRERTTDDAAQSRSATISPQFRREIEAYFRAVAKRAAETSQ